MNKIQRALIIFLLLLGVQMNATAQRLHSNNTVEVKGIVNDEFGAIIGASVIAKGQPGLGVTTDINGKFKLKVGPYDVLVISYIGYQTVELPILKIQDKSNIHITLKEDNKKIDEVNPEKRNGHLYKNEAFQKLQKRNVHEKR